MLLHAILCVSALRDDGVTVMVVNLDALVLGIGVATVSLTRHDGVTPSIECLLLTRSLGAGPSSPLQHYPGKQQL